MISLPAATIRLSLFATLFAVDESLPARRADTGQMMVWLLIAGAVIGVVSVIVVIANRINRHWRYKSPGGLFSGLCSAHGLDAASRRLLKRVVRVHRLRHPAFLFIEPKWLDPAGLGPEFRAQAPALAKLRNSLFTLRPKAADKP